MTDYVSLFIDLAASYGYQGVFLVAILGSLVPYLPIPYLIVVVLLSHVLNPAILGTVAGIGGALGKVTSYALGRCGYRFFGSETKRKMDALRSLTGRYGAIGTFVFAATPLPKDIYYVPLGMMRFSFRRFFLANMAGRILLSVLVAYFGKSYMDFVSFFVGRSSTVLIVTAATSLGVTIVLTRVDWELALEIVRQQGWRGVLLNLATILSIRKQ